MTDERKTNYRLIAIVTGLCAVLILVIARLAQQSPAPPAALARATPLATPTARSLALLPSTNTSPEAPTASARTSSPTDGSARPVGVWLYAGPGATIQLQIYAWHAASTPAVLYISTGRGHFLAMYKGQVVQRTHTKMVLSVAESYTTPLPKSYSWCRRLSGTIASRVRSDEEYLEVAPVCTDGAGPDVIHHSGEGVSTVRISTVLTHSGGHILQLDTTTG
jgi:hypothetical protein